jgi:hypothetical protein
MSTETTAPVEVWHNVADVVYTPGGKFADVTLSDGIRLRIRFVDHSERKVGPKTKTVAYVTDELAGARDATLQALAAAERSLPATTRGENTEIDTFYDTLNRAISRTKVGLAREYTAKVFGTDGSAETAVAKARFSRTAGCSCPCSPGVVLGAMVSFPGSEGYSRLVESFWITEPKADGDPGYGFQS